MAEVGTTDITEFTLPGSGTIRLSQIKSEFNKGNNLTAYYGAASGIPSSGTIKVTDFYGKSAGGGGGSAPNGEYDGSVSGVNAMSAEQGGKTLWLWLCDSNSHGGSYAPMLNEAGTSTVTNIGETDYDNLSRTHLVACFGMSGNSALDYWNQYTYLTVATGQGTTNFTGTWSAKTSPYTYFEFSNSSAGARVAQALSAGSSCWFTLSLNN